MLLSRGLCSMVESLGVSKAMLLRTCSRLAAPCELQDHLGLVDRFSQLS